MMRLETLIKMLNLWFVTVLLQWMMHFMSKAGCPLTTYGWLAAFADDLAEHNQRLYAEFKGYQYIPPRRNYDDDQPAC